MILIQNTKKHQIYLNVVKQTKVSERKKTKWIKQIHSSEKRTEGMLNQTELAERDYQISINLN
jgi:hypothetical protein